MIRPPFVSLLVSKPRHGHPFAPAAAALPPCAPSHHYGTLPHPGRRHAAPSYRPPLPALPQLCLGRHHRFWWATTRSSPSSLDLAATCSDLRAPSSTGIPGIDSHGPVGIWAPLSLISARAPATKSAALHPCRDWRLDGRCRRWSLGAWLVRWARRWEDSPGVGHQIRKEMFHEDLLNKLIREMTDGGVDYSFECTGINDVLREAFVSTHDGWGLTVVLGIHATPLMMPLHPMELFDGRRITGCVFGDFKGKSQLPELVDKCINGEVTINFDGFITHKMPFSDVNKAIQLLQEGKSLRCLLQL